MIQSNSVVTLQFMICDHQTRSGMIAELVDVPNRDDARLSDRNEQLTLCCSSKKIQGWWSLSEKALTDLTREIEE